MSLTQREEHFARLRTLATTSVKPIAREDWSDAYHELMAMMQEPPAPPLVGLKQEDEDNRPQLSLLVAQVLVPGRRLMAHVVGPGWQLVRLVRQSGQDAPAE